MSIAEICMFGCFGFSLFVVIGVMYSFSLLKEIVNDAFGEIK